MSARIESFKSMNQAWQNLEKIDQTYADWDDRLSKNLHCWVKDIETIVNSTQSNNEKWEEGIVKVQQLAFEILEERDPILLPFAGGEVPMDRNIWQHYGMDIPFREHDFAQNMISWFSSLLGGEVPQYKVPISTPTQREVFLKVSADSAEQINYRMEKIIHQMDQAFEESLEKFNGMVQGYVDHHTEQVNELQESTERRIDAMEKAREKETSILIQDNDALHHQTNILGNKVLDAQIKQAELNRDIEQAKKDKVILSRKLDSTEQSVRQLDQKANRLHQENLNLGSNLGAAQSSIRSLEAQNGSLKERISYGENIVNQLRNTINHQRQEMEGLRRANAHLRQAVNDLDDDNGLCSIM